MKKVTVFLWMLSLIFAPAAVLASAESLAPAEPVTVSAPDPAEMVHLTMYFAVPASSPCAQGGRRIAELVRDATQGSVQMEVIAGGGFSEQELLEQCMSGAVDMAACGNSLLSGVIPSMSILEQAYLWENAAEAHAAVDGRLGELIREGAQEQGIHVIGFEDAGFCNVFSTEPFLKAEDFPNMRIRRMESPSHREAFEALGASLIPVPAAEIKEAMREGTINACECAAANFLSSGYYEVARNVIFTQHTFSYEILCMSDEAWQRIPEELRETVLQAVEEGVSWERTRVEEADTETRQELGMLGISFYRVDMTEYKEMVRKAAEGKAPNLTRSGRPRWRRPLPR